MASDFLSQEEVNRLLQGITGELTASGELIGAMLALDEADVYPNIQKAALELCLEIFQSMAARGDYPRELLQGDPNFIEKSGGGWQFILDALKAGE